MIEKHRFEIGVALASVMIVGIGGLLTSQVNSIATAIGAWLLICLILVVTFAWING